MAIPILESSHSNAPGMHNMILFSFQQHFCPWVSWLNSSSSEDKWDMLVTLSQFPLAFQSGSLSSKWWWDLYLNSHVYYTLTWSWTSSSHNSSCMILSKGRKRASLKWKWGGSFQLVRTSVSISWMKETAFWDTCLSLWQAACNTHEEVEDLRIHLIRTCVLKTFFLYLVLGKPEEAILLGNIS